MTDYPHLFSPLAVGGVTLRNRLALPATLTNYARDSVVTERWQSFLIERARGGTGLLITEVIAVDPLAIAHSAIVAGYDERNDQGLAATAQTVHDAGAHIVAQLWHPGRQQLWQPSHSPMGVSDQPDAYSWTVPHVMGEAELERLVAAYVAVAARLDDLGFDGVELHGAHGYLITQLLSPWSNTRTDRFGGSREGRARFCSLIAQGIRSRCREGFITGLKMPASEGVAGGIDAEEAWALTAHLAATGQFDYFAYGQGNFSRSLEDHVPDMHYNPAHFVHLAKRMRSAAGNIPVMALGRIGTPELAEQVIAGGAGDLVGASRAQVADAAFANKARRGQAAIIRPAVFNNFCWGEVHAGKPLAELHNPYLALRGEADARLPAARAPRDIAIIGAGPAGLEAAWTAAARGHRVTLYGASVQPGGKLVLEACLPGHGEMRRIIDYQQRRAAQFAVNFELGRVVDPQTLATISADAIVLATGALARVPTIPVDETVQLMSVYDIARQCAKEGLPRGAVAVVYDHDHTAPTYAAALALRERFERIILVTPRTHIAQAVNYCSALGIHRRLHRAEVEMILGADLVRAENGTVVIADVFSGREQVLQAVSILVYSTPRRVVETLSPHVGERELHLIGDCMAPRNLHIALHEGHALGRML